VDKFEKAARRILANHYVTEQWPDRIKSRNDVTAPLPLCWVKHLAELVAGARLLAKFEVGKKK
jgi:hypothetical protein